MAGVAAQFTADQQLGDQIGIVARHAAGRKKLVAKFE
jgi:hypothetical protein